MDSRYRRMAVRGLGIVILLYIYLRPSAWRTTAWIADSTLIALIINLVWMMFANGIVRAWWIVLAPSVLIADALALSFVLHLPNEAGSFLWPCIAFLASVPKNLRKLGLVFAILMGATMLILPYPNTLSLPEILGIPGLYLGILGGRLRREAQEVREEHLQELEHAHAELQDATLDSMRYAALAERTRISEALHDSLGHELTSLIVQLQALQKMAVREPERVSEALALPLQQARGALYTVRETVHAWADHDQQAGPEAMRGLVHRMQGQNGISIVYEERNVVHGWGRSTQVVLFRCLQESLTNILRHAEADKVDVLLQEGEGFIELSIVDNGSATKDAEPQPGFGLRSMKTRVESLGGTFVATSVDPHGYSVCVRLPADSVDADELLGDESTYV